MDAALQTILDFVEGRMSGYDFEQKVYHDPALERLLSDESLRWNGTYIDTNPYDFIIAEQFSDPAGLLNVQGAMELFLTKKGVTFRADTTNQDFHRLLLEAQPEWLDLDTAYLKEHVLSESEGRTGNELKRWLGGRLKELFRYHENPPEWIQGAAWPINENGPLYFLGQIEIADCELFHDVSEVYLFIDPRTGVTETVIQSF